MTIKEYMAFAGVTGPAISYRIKKNKKLPGVDSYSYNKLTRMYDLKAEKKVDWDNVKLLFRTHD